jgi:hypothetical protein
MRVGEDPVVGWLETSIRTIIQNDASVISQFTFVLVTSIDSISDIPSAAVGQRIIRQCARCEALGKGLLIPAHALVGIASKLDLFSSFDEVWCFDNKPVSPKPSNLSIVPPVDLQSEDWLRLLSSWMQGSCCKLGLGDGTGLYYATPNVAVAKRLEELPCSKA